MSYPDGTLTARYFSQGDPATKFLAYVYFGVRQYVDPFTNVDFAPARFPLLTGGEFASSANLGQISVSTTSNPGSKWLDINGRIGVAVVPDPYQYYLEIPMEFIDSNGNPLPYNVGDAPYNYLTSGTARYHEGFRRFQFGVWEGGEWAAVSARGHITQFDIDKVSIMTPKTPPFWRSFYETKEVV